MAAYEKHTVTMPSATWQELRERAGTPSISTYVAASVSRQLARDALDDTLMRMEALHGPVSQHEVAAIMARLRD